MEDANKYVNSKYGPTILRVVLGLLFILPGLNKLANPGMIIGMLGQLGFPAAGLFGWILLLSEILFGAAVLVGWKLRYTVWPLVVVLAVATLLVGLPALAKDPMAMINISFHLLGIAALISLYLTGAGAMAVKQD
ncbi:MAG: DoxX family protein [Nanoarchaeota archaeon]